jgi:hypothetical protein
LIGAEIGIKTIAAVYSKCRGWVKLRSLDVQPADLGDIDLIIEVQPRRKKHTDDSHYRAGNSGKSLDWFAGLNYGDKEVLQLLRARKPRLSFNAGSLDLDTEFRTLFEWQPDAKRRAEMVAFDWRLQEPLRQVNEWLASNPGINTDSIEIARWCQDVAAMSRGRNPHHRLFHNWSNNAAHELMSYWGVPASNASAERTHRLLWEEYRERVRYYVNDEYAKSVDAIVEAEIYAHFMRDTDHMDAAILVAKRFRWKFVEDSGGWVSPLRRRIEEIEGRD